MKKIIRDLPHILTLAGIFIAALVGFWVFSYDRFFQGAVAIALSVSYVAWGIVHHKLHNNLYLAVVVEYVLVASLGLIIVFSLIFNS